MGRGLNALQLQDWFHALERHGRPTSDLLVVSSDALRTNTAATYRRILTFLRLKIPNRLPSFPPAHNGTYRSGRDMTEEVRAQLESFYEPYNRQLADLLGDEWDGIWQYNDLERKRR